MTTWFDEARLDDERVLAGADPMLRTLAEAGARVRRDRVQVGDALERAVAHAHQADRPRAVVAAGPDSRLLRAVLEPWCPVPFVAWPMPGLPGWVGSLDLVVVLAPDGSDHGSALAVTEALRRGAQVVVAAPEKSLVTEHAEGRWCHLLPIVTGDQSAAAVVMLEFLDRVDLGPRTDVEDVAGALDHVATVCSPHQDLSVNPAKLLAIALADRTPVVWGGTVLAARAARRVAESLRRATGVSAIAGDAEHLLPVLESAPLQDLFDDPLESDSASLPPVLVVLDDGSDEPVVAEQRDRLVRAAGERRVRVETLTCDPGATSELARYASLLLQGRYAAAYLQIGLTGE
ncbi:SIS domain-containing protein [Nocardioides daphniae]|uniref:SIS domain-containing protein n=1 Tax=Nocardioides daphniae TaxID=402297 RepID=UPI001E545E1F|nr:SIS domain-containing protein [Nocardioides daphniae]